MPKKQIYLTGFMGTGKSMILNCLHEVCGFDKIEMDEQIVQEQGMSIPEIFEKKGEEYFPELSSPTLLTINSVNCMYSLNIQYYSSALPGAIGQYGF